MPITRNSNKTNIKSNKSMKNKISNKSIKKMQLSPVDNKHEKNEIEIESESTSDDSYAIYDDKYNEDDIINLEDIGHYVKKTDKNAYMIWKDVETVINDSKPSPLKILNLPISNKQKSKLMELFEVYISCDGMEKLNIKYKINSLVKKDYKKYENDDNIIIEKFKRSEAYKTYKSVNDDAKMKMTILNLNTTDENKAIIYKKWKDLKTMKKCGNDDGDEYCKLKKWLTWAISLPYDNVIHYSACKLSLLSSSSSSSSSKVVDISSILNSLLAYLDEELYGMRNVKEQLLVYFNMKLRNPSSSGTILGLVGMPGTGKTAIVKCLSTFLKIPFEQITHVTNPEFICGHDYTYIGSEPGEIVKCLSRMKCKNGILFFDEFEKNSKNQVVLSTLLNVMDFKQNVEFKDNFLSELKLDLSKLMFICSMNNLPDDLALKDRLFVINVEPYSNDEKVKIIRNYLFPKALSRVGRKENDIIISESVSEYINNVYGNTNTGHTTIYNVNNVKSGVRKLEHLVNDIVNKLYFLISNDKLKLPISFNLQKVDLKFPLTLNESIIDKLLYKY